MKLYVPYAVQKKWLVKFRYADLFHHRSLLDLLAAVVAVVQSIVVVDVRIYLEYEIIG